MFIRILPNPQDGRFAAKIRLAKNIHTVEISSDTSNLRPLPGSLCGVPAIGTSQRRPDFVYGSEICGDLWEQGCNNLGSEAS